MTTAEEVIKALAWQEPMVQWSGENWSGEKTWRVEAWGHLTDEQMQLVRELLEETDEKDQDHPR